MTTPADDLEKAQERLAALAASGDSGALLEALEELHPSDIADLVEELEDDAQVRVLSSLPPEVASETLAEMEEGEDRGDLLAALTPAKGAELLQELADDDAADLLGELEPEERHRIFDALPAQDAGDIRGLLLYGEETAGGLMTTELVSLEASLSAAQALDEVRRQGREMEQFYTVFVVDGEHRLLGTVGLDVLVTAQPEAKVGAMVEPVLASVLPHTDQEEVGRLMARYNLVSMAVVNDFGVLLGRITFDDVLDVMEAEQTEDILRLAGVGGDEEALRYTWTESVRSRLPWLFVNLLTAFLAASVVYAFQGTIRQVVILASIMPIIAGMGGNAGTQALAVAVRSLAVEGRWGGRRAMAVVAREVMVGVANGAALGLLVALVAMATGEGARLGLVVLFAMWGNLVVAGFAGAFIPVTLHWMGVDPAVASSVFVTTFTDLCGFLLLLGMATAFLV